MTEKKQYISTEPTDKIKFYANRPEEQKAYLKITNCGDMRQAFKVKCSRNDLFRIKPATGLIEHHQTMHVMLIFKKGKDKTPVERQYFGVYSIPAPERCTCEGAWAEHYGRPLGERKLKVIWDEQ